MSDWKNWKDYERAAEKGPFSIFWRIFLIVLAITAVVMIAGYFIGWFTEGAQVAKEEFGPRAALEKYEWFIDQENRIQKMDQDIAVFEDRYEAIEREYVDLHGKDKTIWSPLVQAQYSHERRTARDDLVAVVSQRNNLTQEYNAQSEKFNWEPFKSKPDKPVEGFADYPFPE